jgi:hypothetical protein
MAQPVKQDVLFCKKEPKNFCDGAGRTGRAGAQRPGLAPTYPAQRGAREKSFLLLFFKKEVLSSFISAGLTLRSWRKPHARR